MTGRRNIRAFGMFDFLKGNNIMNKKDGLQTGKDVMKLVVLTAAAVAAITTALTFFAKAKTVQALDQRIWLNTSQDIVRHKESDVQWTEQRFAFQRRDEGPTLAETEILAKAKQELEVVKKVHQHRVKVFEDQYKQKY